MNNKYLLSVLFFLINVYFSLAQQTVGLFQRSPGSLDGYVLFAPIQSNNTYLIDKCGKLVHTWNSIHHPGQSVYLLEDGTLLRPGSTGNSVFTSGGNGGIIEKFSWNSSVLWSYSLSTATECQHHDIRQLRNGNVLAIVWELKTVSQATTAGRNPALLGTSLWSEKIVELQPVGSNGANIVWEWHAWDHLVQDYDPAKSNYGIVSQHPELLNLNYVTGPATAADWLHCNSIDYNELLDQVIISSHNLNECWIIDHSTTTAEAATHTGGVHGRGGDLLYRWGNAAAYNRGTAADKKLFGQHHVHWIDSGMTDAGKIMIFNNGQGRPGGNYSSIDIITPPVDSAGNYTLTASQPYLPDSAGWIYRATVPADFYAVNISGAQRLSNGNTLICEGPQGTFFEIDSAKNTVWRYVNPVAQSGILNQGTTPAMNLVFRCTGYEPTFSGFSGQILIPGNPIELNPLSYTCMMITGEHNTKAMTGILFQVSNPFSTVINFAVEEELQDASVKLTDVTGRIIENWWQPYIPAGNSIQLKLKTSLPGGVYLLNINTSKYNFTSKLIHTP
jgi:hypothetical protein